MLYDMKSGPATFVLLQEGTDAILKHPKAPGEAGVKDESVQETRAGGELRWKVRPTVEYIGLRGYEPGEETSTIICARSSLVQNMRLRLFWVAVSTYRKRGRDKVGKTRIMVVTCKMRYFFPGQQRRERKPRWWRDPWINPRWWGAFSRQGVVADEHAPALRVGQRRE